MKAYDENTKYILFINKSITILGCSTVNSLTIGFLGHIFQQLPLVLKPLGIVSNIHLRLVVVELLYLQGFNEGVGQVLLSVDLLKVDITSIHDLPDQVEAAQDVLRLLMCFRFLRLSYGTSVVIVEQDRTIEGGCYSELDDELDRKSTRLNSSHSGESRMPSSA